MNYLIVEEASEAVLKIHDNLDEAIEDAKGMPGKILVVEDYPSGEILYDTMPGVTYKI